MGSLIIACVVAWILARINGKFCQWFDLIINKEAKYERKAEKFLELIKNE